MSLALNIGVCLYMLQLAKGMEQTQFRKGYIHGLIDSAYKDVPKPNDPEVPEEAHHSDKCPKCG